MSHPNFIIEFNFHNQISAASPLLSLLLLFDASDDVVHVPARSLLLEAGDHGVDVLVVAPSPPEITSPLESTNTTSILRCIPIPRVDWTSVHGCII